MSWPVLEPQEVLRRLQRGTPALDVRSPLEFAECHIPGFVNIAILNNDHRHRVGWAYKHQGQAKAIELGLELTAPVREDLVGAWRAALAGQSGMVACWRGGLRSQIASQWLAESGAEGHRVKGGYKAMRALLMAEIEKPRDLVILAGLTGSGKTELLRQLPERLVLDLEKLANHRGSAFGGFLSSPQPRQQTFENAVGLTLLGRSGTLVVENESALIGRCAVPPVLRKAIAESPVVRLNCTLDERVGRVFAEYVAEPLGRHAPQEVRDALVGALKRIERALGGLRTKEAVECVELAFVRGEHTVESHRPWIESLLKGYYDPMYEYGIQRDHRQLRFEGGFTAVRDYLAHLADRRGP